MTSATPSSSDAEPDLVAVFVTTGVATSDGPGPGGRRLPRAEAGRLVSARLAVHGERPPRGYIDGGCDGREIGLMMPRKG
jgi:hypothetical protein